MARPSVAIVADAAAVARTAAEHLAAAIGQTAGSFALALSGGSTPQALYTLLAADEFAARIPWARVHVFFADERAVPPDHPDSNFGMVRERLLSRVSLPPANVHRMRGEAEDLDAAACEYESELREVCPPATPEAIPALDLVLLGIGEDGHTASLFPGSSALEETQRWVVAAEGPPAGRRRLTLTRPALAAARQTLFLVSGAAKAEIVAGVLCGEIALPAALVTREARQAFFLLDEAAAAAWREGGVPPQTREP